MLNLKVLIKNLLNPSSIAVVGATDKPGSFGFKCSHFALASSVRDNVFLVNPTKKELFERPVYATLKDLPIVPDCVAICLPYSKVNDILSQCGELGIHAAVVFASGYSEIPDPAGNEREAELLELCKKYNIAVLGPNCGGYNNRVNNVMLWGLWMNHDKLERTNLGISIISQSGGIVANLFNSIYTDVSYALSIGNSSVVTPEEYMDYVLDDENTRVVAMYIEGLKRPAAFCRALKKAADLRKPVVILKGGKGEKGILSAMAHTGNYAGNYEVFCAVAKRYGAIVVSSEDELITTCTALATLNGQYTEGCGATNINLSGGQTTQCADSCDVLGIPLPDFDIATIKELKKRLPDFATVKNPLDATTELYKDLHRCAELFQYCGNAPGVDYVIFTAANLSSFETHDENALKAIRYAREDGFEKPIFIVPNYELSRDYKKWLEYRDLRAAVMSPGMTGYSEIKSIGDFFAHKKKNYSTVTAAFESNMLNSCQSVEGDGVALLSELQITLEEEAKGVETHLSVIRDAQFGPVVTLRLGGEYGAYINNHAVGLCPLTRDEAVEMTEQLDFYDLIKNNEKLTDVIESVAAYAAENARNLIEISMELVVGKDTVSAKSVEVFSVEE